MKKSFLIIATVVLTIFNLQASNNHYKNRIVKSNPTPKVVKIYDWQLQLENGAFSGTSLTKEAAQRILNILSKGEFVLQQKITSYYVLQSDTQVKNYRNFYWEVTSENGYAKGFASSKSKAEKLVKLVAQGDIITFKIIKSNSLK